jgi:hypothetical protein
MTEQHDPSGPSIVSPTAEQQPGGVDGASSRQNVCWNNQARAPAEDGYYWRWDRFAMIILCDQNEENRPAKDDSVTKYESSERIGGKAKRVSSPRRVNVVAKRRK